MSMKFFGSLVVFSGIVAAWAVPAAAGRAPTAEERARIEQSLRAAGYVSWEEIDLDGKLWEADDARRAGQSPECDVKIRPGTYEIVREDCD